FVIAAYCIEERVLYAELASASLLDDPRYEANAHVRRNRLIPDSDTRFAVWRGGPGSRLLAQPLRMDRGFIESLGLLSQEGMPWDWDQHNKHGRAFTELQLIGFHTRATRRLDERQTAWLIAQLARLPARASL